jgi:hypothetical protein
MSVRHLALVAVSAFLIGSLAADDKKAGKPDLNAMMAAMAKHGQPGEHHKALAHLAGKWKMSGKMWMDPAADPMPFAGTSERKLIMDGRFLADQVSGDESFPFEGKGWVGYDNHTKKLTWAWIDSSTTSIGTGEGTFDPATKTFTMTGESYDPTMGKVVKGKEVTQVKGDTIVSTFYKNLDGKDVKGMEITYTKMP